MAKTDAEVVADIKTRRDAILNELAAMTTSKVDYSIDGQSVQHANHRAALLRELSDLNKLLTQLGGTWEVTTEGVS